MNQEAHTLEFQARMMGTPTRAERVPGDGGLTLPQLRAWVAAAASNPSKRDAGAVRMGVYASNLPTPEDAARTPTEAPPRTSVLLEHLPDGTVIAGKVRGSDGAVLAHITPEGRIVGLCPCESGHGFSLCHGADYADRDVALA